MTFVIYSSAEVVIIIKVRAETVKKIEMLK